MGQNMGELSDICWDPAALVGLLDGPGWLQSDNDVYFLQKLHRRAGRWRRGAEGLLLYSSYYSHWKRGNIWSVYFGFSFQWRQGPVRGDCRVIRVPHAARRVPAMGGLSHELVLHAVLK